jgi:hypothetical protein
MRARNWIVAGGAIALLIACDGGGPGTFNGFDFYQNGNAFFDPGGTGDSAKPTNDPESSSNDPGSCYVQAGTYSVTFSLTKGGSQCPADLGKENGTSVIKQGGSLADLVKAAQDEGGCTVVLSGCTASFHCTTETTTTTTSSPDGGQTTTTSTQQADAPIDETVTVRGDGFDGTVTIDGCTYSFSATFVSSDTSDQNQNKPGTPNPEDAGVGSGSGGNP